MIDNSPAASAGAAWRRCVLTALALLLGGCGREAAGLPLRIEISHVVGAAPLRLNQDYRSAAGDEWSAAHLRYYLSNFRLRRADGTWWVNPQEAGGSRGYFLVDEADAASKQFALGPVPPGTYGAIEFLVGVDAARNHAGAQSGTLDPARGMFWTWNTGYIFFLFEGRSPQSPDAGQALTWHVGGGNAAARRVVLQLPEPLPVTAQQGGEVHLHADLARLFDGVHVLRPAALPNAMEPASSAAVADNSAGLFRIDHLHRLPRSELLAGT